MSDERFKVGDRIPVIPSEPHGAYWQIKTDDECAAANAAYALCREEVDGAAEAMPGCTAFWKNIVYETGEQDGMVVEHEDDTRTYGPSLTGIILAAAKTNPTERTNNAD